MHTLSHKTARSLIAGVRHAVSDDSSALCAATLARYQAEIDAGLLVPDPEARTLLEEFLGLGPAAGS